MKIFVGYILATLVGTVFSQSLLSLLQGLQSQPRIIQVRRNDMWDLLDPFQHNLVPTARAVRTHASAAASASAVSLASINDLLSRYGLTAARVQPSVSNLAVRRAPRVSRPRHTTFIVDQRVQAAGLQSPVPAAPAVPAVQAPIPAGAQIAGVPGAIPAGAQFPDIPAGGLQNSPAGTTVLFDRPDPQTPETPELVYAPRSMMGDMQQIEALRKRTEADGVIFV